MKKTLLTFGLAAMLFASCATDPDGLNTIVPQGTPQINISGDIDQQYATRVDENGFCDGDQVGLYGVNYTNDNTVAGTLMDEGNQVNNALYTYSTENGTFTSSGSFYYKDAQTNIDLYAYYPFAHPEVVNAYEFEVALDQNQGTGHAMSDFLWAKATNVTPSENKVGLRFSHRLSLANVILKEGTGFANGEFDNLSKSVLALNTTRTATIDLSTGIATAVGEPENEGIIMKATDNGFRAIVVPQSIVGATPLFAITIDGISYRFKRDVTTDYEAGKMAKFTITINRKAHTGTYELVLTDTSIEDWEADIDTYGGEARQYYVVHLDEAGTLKTKITEAKKNPAKIKNLKVSGEVGSSDLQFMREKMTILQSINLKESRLVGKWSCHVWYPSGSGTVLNFEGIKPETYEECKAIVLAYAEKNDIVLGSIGEAEQMDEPDVIPEDAFKNMSTLINFVFPEKVTEICFQAFYNCSMLSDALIIPDDVVEIGARAFENCSNITSLALPPHLKKIKGRAFFGCSALSGNLELPSSLVDIDYSAFESCSGFTGQLVLPNNLTHLGNYAFRGCSGFTGDLVIPTTLTEIQYEMFSDCSGFNGRLVLHDGISKIEGSAFRYCNFQGELKLPANLLNVPDNCFYGCQFSTIAEFPKGLIEIGDQAFYNNSRLMGTLELPDELVALGKRAFYGCKNLESVVLPAELNILKEGLFQSCNKLNKITCKATVPPIVQNYAFGGISKECIVEVPEESVTKYQADVNWGEFTHISAHHDFYLSRSKMRTLNAEHSRNFVLYAPSGFAWSIESCPEWVTVTPSSGVGKAEVTITVNQMTETDNGHFEANWENWPFSTANIRTGGRTGDVVFLLNDKDYRTTMTVEQFKYQYDDGDVIVNQIATAVDPKDGINIVFMGDCFDALDITMNWYTTTINKAIEHFFAVEPYKSYRDYFNVYTVIGMSNDSKVGTIDTIREGKFGSQYSLSGVLPDTQITYEYALKAETVNMDNINKTLIVMIENSSEYGGTTALWSDGSAIAVCPISDDAYPYDFRGIVQHEACGHAFAKLADETTCYCEFINGSHLDEFKKGKALGFYRNLELTGDMNKVGWNHMIFNPTYSNIVDVYEGGYYYTRGVYRSEPVSCMQNNIPYFSAISRQEAVERIMRYSGQQFSISDFYAKDVLDLQGNKATQSVAAPTAISLTGAGKQMPPKYMGHSPFDK